MKARRLHPYGAEHSLQENMPVKENGPVSSREFSHFQLVASGESGWKHRTRSEQLHLKFSRLFSLLFSPWGFQKGGSRRNH
jgi:hypothetical protein